MTINNPKFFCCETVTYSTIQMFGNEFLERCTYFLSLSLANPCDLPSRMSSGCRLSFPSGKAAQHEADHSLTIAADYKNSWR
jgi:hypothetical protein